MAAKSTKKSDNASNTPQQSILSKSAEGAKFLILLQVGSRALTFGVNQILLRYLTPSILGISTQLEIYQISVLYFARESLRVAVQRQFSEEIQEARRENNDATVKVPPGQIAADTEAGRTQTVVNLAYIPIYLGVPLAAGLASLYLRSASPLVLETPWFRESLNLFGVAAFWELLTEPCFVVVQQRMLYRVRAVAETLATLARCLVTAGVALYSARRGWDAGLLPFAIGQMAFGLALFVTYYWQIWNVSALGGFRLSTQVIYSRDPNAYVLSYWSQPLLTLGATLFVQSGVKHVLTQGDSVLVATLSNIEDQGVYALVSNYGGLIARMLFQPIEESSRALFATLLGSSVGKAPQKENAKSAMDILTLLLRFYALLSVLAASIGPTAAPLFLNLIAGKRWAAYGAGHVLGIYCNYIPLLAVNGVLEAFVSSTATSAQLRGQSVWMVGFSLVFAGAGFLFLRVLQWGAEGLVWANAVNMVARIIWSAVFIQNYLRKVDARIEISAILPQLSSLAAGAGVYAAMLGVKGAFRGDVMDLIRCGSVAIPGALIILFLERRFLLECYQILGNKQASPPPR
ncbi:MAG: Oligosaccharide translocation protein rft1 [Vezdaea aestivalis]|nr:MAG: Oligosaccharide translocation protein rft1 [Vezdaea aestivalis]